MFICTAKREVVSGSFPEYLGAFELRNREVSIIVQIWDRRP